VLFDEVEKAHPEVFNVLLQVLDDGRITDSQGRTVDFKNTIIILTSNLGSQYLLEGISADGSISDEARKAVEALLYQSFRPEFLNRLDEIVMYKPLTRDNIGRIADLQIASVAKRLAERNLGLEVSEEAKEFIIAQSFDPLFGARPMKRYIQDNLETLIARCMLENDLSMGDRLIVGIENGALAISIARHADAELIG
jgi:ATP-dependent Clp protease ATP-binding subunit ClpB